MIIQDTAGQVLSIGDHVVFGTRSKSSNRLMMGKISGFTPKGYVRLESKTIQSSTSDLLKIPAEVAKNFYKGTNTLDAIPATKEKSKITV